MLSSYRGNSGASSPSVSDKAIAVSFSGAFSTPLAITDTDTPYTIPASTLPIQTFLCGTGTGILTINLPAAPVEGQIINIKRTTAEGNALTIGRNGNNIEGAAANFVDANAALSYYSFQYHSTTGWWLIG
jgi:hypothetical protein